MRKGIVWGSAVALLIALPSGVVSAMPPSTQPSSAWANRPITSPVTSDSPDFIGPRIEHRAVEPSRAQARAPMAVSRMNLARTRMGAISVAGELNAELYQWSFDQMGCLVDLWDHESKWNYKSVNRESGAHGIAQFMPSTWGNYGVEKTSEAKLQIKYGLRYIFKRYGSENDPHGACNAWAFWQKNKWY